MEQLNKQIDINLQLLFDAPKNQMLSYEFLKPEGGKITQRIRGDEFAMQMSMRNLISTNGSLCTISEHGYEIVKNGGWLAYKNRERIDEQESNRISALNNQKLEYDVRLSKW